MKWTNPVWYSETSSLIKAMIWEGSGRFPIVPPKCGSCCSIRSCIDAILSVHILIVLGISSQGRGGEEADESYKAVKHYSDNTLNEVWLSSYSAGVCRNGWDAVLISTNSPSSCGLFSVPQTCVSFFVYPRTLSNFLKWNNDLPYSNPSYSRS